MKKSQMKQLIPVLALFISASGFAAESSANSKVKVRVTVTNVTAANGLSPFLAIVLKKGASLFTVGSPASAGIAAVAETGNTTPLEAELAQNASVLATSKASGGPIPAGESRSIELELNRRDVLNGATLKLVAMIGRSNDSFISLPTTSLSTVLHYGKLRLDAVNYDAGSEENTGNVEDFGAGGHPVDAAEGRISIDRGLNARGNAPEIIGWGPVAGRVLIEKVN